MVRNKLVLLATAGLVAGALAAPQAASAKTVKVKIAAKGDPTKFPSTAAKLTGTLGAGTQSKCCAKLPDFDVTWTFKGKYKGTVKVHYAPKLNGVIAAGSWKVKSGTGKFKGAKGGGKMTSNITNGKYAFTGSIKLK